MDKLREMRAFVAVVEGGSFVAAADALASSTTAVSRYVSEMEARLRTRLLQRTTRRLSLTDEGRVFVERCKEVLDSVAQAESELTDKATQPSGLLRVNAPMTFGIAHLAPLWGAFLALHPKLQLEVALADRIVDVVEEGYDLAIRIAALPNSTLVSRRFASTRLVLCASPAYLAAHGTPQHPSELAQHSIISYSYGSTKDEWRFDGAAGEVRVRTQPRLHTNNGDTCRSAALAHQGIILQPTFLIGEDVKRGDLLEIAPQYRAMELGIYAVYPSRTHLSPKVRSMVEYLAAAFAKPSWEHSCAEHKSL